MGLFRKLLPVAGMLMMGRFGRRMGPAALLLGGGRRTMAGLAAGYLAKKAFDSARSRRVRRAY